MTKTVVVAAVVLGTILSMGLTGCGPTPSPVDVTALPTAAAEPQRGGIVVISYGGGTPRHFNPALVSGSSRRCGHPRRTIAPFLTPPTTPYSSTTWRRATSWTSMTRCARCTATRARRPGMRRGYCERRRAAILAGICPGVDGQSSSR